MSETKQLQLMKIYAMITDEGTAADETALCEHHLSHMDKLPIPDDVNDLPFKRRQPIASLYKDVSLNEECRCIVCGKNNFTVSPTYQNTRQ